MSTPSSHPEGHIPRTGAPPEGVPDVGVAATKQTQPWVKNLSRTLFAIIGVASVATATAFSFASGSSGVDPRANLTIIAPAGVGGGWDSFAREQQQAMRGAGVVNNAQVVNIPGAGGTIGLSAFVTKDGEASNILATGTAMLGGIVINDSPVNLDSTRPLARIAEDYDVMVVAADSPYNSVEDLVKAWKANPKKLRFTGGSAGSIDHLIIAQLAIDQGIPADNITYIPKSGGGEAMQTLLSNTTDVAVTGFNEVEDQIAAGRVKPLGLSAPKRLEGVDIATFEELGFKVNLVNWRGLLAPPGIDDKAFEALEQIVTETRNSEEWMAAMKRNRWVDSFLTGDELRSFLKEDQQRVAELVTQLGLGKGGK